MKLTQDQIEKTNQVWNFYNQNEQKFVNDKKIFSGEEINKQRTATIPQILELMNKFIGGEMALGAFKSQIDSINKRNRLWGFMAINGQMFFNMLTKCSQSGGVTDQFIALLKLVISVPADLADACVKMQKFETFVSDLRKYSKDGRSAPKVGSIPFFLSYFWQIQKPDIFPIYYTSMVQAFQNLDIWSQTKNVVNDYAEYFELNHALLDYLRTTYTESLSIWDLEHIFWLHYLKITDEPAPDPDVAHPKPKPDTNKANLALPESFIPPVVSILPKLSINDPDLAQICKESGKSIDRVFEERLAILFGMLGFDTVLLGQGKGRVPDGVAVTEEHRYGIIYDAKVREKGYSIGTDERAIKEYINSQTPALRRRGFDSLYYFIISSNFIGNNARSIPGIKIETRINEVIFVEVKALLLMLDAKLRNPNINLGPDGLQQLFASSGVLTEEDIREYFKS